ncbi:MAG: wax ester/triacylglycerol synthase domain-containing protein [Acidimicrobiales bacterium]
MADLQFEQRMSDSDALMWTIEKDPSLRSTITAIAFLDRVPDRDRLRTLVDRGTRLVPRMRQRVRSNPMSVAPPRWEVDPNFDLQFHLRWVRAGGDRTVRSVLDQAEPIAMQGFDRARPLWEITVVEGMEDDRAALILKVHHAITDGVGAVKIALVMFELERDPASAATMPDEPPVRVMSQVERFLDAIDHERRRNLGVAKRSVGTVAGGVSAVASDPLGALGRAGLTAASVLRLLMPATAPLSPLMTRRSLSVHFDTITVNMADAKAAAKRADGTLNDAFLAATAEGFRRYHDELGAPTAELRMTMPINVRTDETADAAGNQFVPARFSLPIDIDDPQERMRAFHALVTTQRAEPAMTLVDPLARVLNRLPTSVTTGAFGAMLKGVDLVTSNVPGAPIPIFMAGAQLDGLFAFGPMTGAAVNLTLFSYLGDLLIGVNLDPAAVTEPDRLVAALREGWDEVLSP